MSKYYQFLHLLVQRFNGLTIEERTTQLEGTPSHFPSYISALKCGPYRGNSCPKRTKKDARYDAARSLVEDDGFRKWVETNAVRPMPKAAYDLIPEGKRNFESIKDKLEADHIALYGKPPSVQVCKAGSGYNCVLEYGHHLPMSYGKTPLEAITSAYVMLDRILTAPQMQEIDEMKRVEKQQWKSDTEREQERKFKQHVDRCSDEADLLVGGLNTPIPEGFFGRDVRGVAGVNTYVEPITYTSSPVHYGGVDDDQQYSRRVVPGRSTAMSYFEQEMCAKYMSVDETPIVICDDYIDELSRDDVSKICDEGDLEYVHEIDGSPRESIKSVVLPLMSEVDFGYAVLPMLLERKPKYVCFISKDPTLIGACKVLRGIGVPTFVLDSEQSVRLWLRARMKMKYYAKARKRRFA